MPEDWEMSRLVGWGGRDWLVIHWTSALETNWYHLIPSCLGMVNLWECGKIIWWNKSWECLCVYVCRWKLDRWKVTGFDVRRSWLGVGVRPHSSASPRLGWQMWSWSWSWAGLFSPFAVYMLSAVWTLLSGCFYSWPAWLSDACLLMLKFS